jgi:hypothetical protein
MRWLLGTFYDHQVDRGLGWGGHLTQGDVDELVANGSLSHWQADDGERGRWVYAPFATADVNANSKLPYGPQRDPALNLDSHSVYLLARRRCRLLGAADQCDHCAGRAFACTDEQYAAYSAWTCTEPPTGEGWQLWETCSEGSPVTPVFASADDLAAACAGMFGASREDWAVRIAAGDVDSMLLVVEGEADSMQLADR